MDVPGEMAEVVRSVVFELHRERSTMPTVSSVLEALADKQQMRRLTWKWGRTTLYRFMLKIFFEFVNRKRYYEYTKERDDIVEQRASYLEWIREYRKKG